jgi:flagellin
LATQAASSSGAANAATLNAEYQDVKAEIDREAAVAGIDAGQTFSVFVSNDGTHGMVGGSVGAVTATGLGLSTAIDTALHAQSAVDEVTAAITALGAVQAQVGTIQNRLQYAVSLAQSQVVNFQAAESRIRDANIAEESANLTRYSILNQSGIAALAQANQSTAAVLALLR